jgi:hypothetical protein
VRIGVRQSYILLARLLNNVPRHTLLTITVIIQKAISFVFMCAESALDIRLMIAIFVFKASIYSTRLVARRYMPEQAAYIVVQQVNSVLVGCTYNMVARRPSFEFVNNKSCLFLQPLDRLGQVIALMP